MGEGWFRALSASKPHTCFIHSDHSFFILTLVRAGDDEGEEKKKKTSCDMPGIQWTYFIPGPLVPHTTCLHGIQWIYSISRPTQVSHMKWEYQPRVILAVVVNVGDRIFVTSQTQLQR